MKETLKQFTPHQIMIVVFFLGVIGYTVYRLIKELKTCDDEPDIEESEE